jgi:hypothetical protein
VTFEDRVRDHNQGPDEGEKFIRNSKNRHGDTHLGSWKNSKGFGVGMLKRGKIHYSQAHFTDF